MPVGNDIVDLQDPEALPGASHPRFDLRVFTRDERARLLRCHRPTTLRWRFWAAKESAFKAARQLDQSTRFLPRRFTLGPWEGAGYRVVHSDGARFRVRIEATHGWIHAVAAPDPSDEVGRSFLESDTMRDSDRTIQVQRIEGPRTACDPGGRVRELAATAAASLLSLCPSEIRIRKVAGIPRAERRGRVLPVSISLSHHGRFVACACVLEQG